MARHQDLSRGTWAITFRELHGADVAASPLTRTRTVLGHPVLAIGAALKAGKYELCGQRLTTLVAQLFPSIGRSLWELSSITEEEVGDRPPPSPSPLPPFRTHTLTVPHASWL